MITTQTKIRLTDKEMTFTFWRVAWFYTLLIKWNLHWTSDNDRFTVVINSEVWIESAVSGNEMNKNDLYFMYIWEFFLYFI